MYSRRNKDYREEYPYSLPPRYSGSRFRRSDGRVEDSRIFTGPPMDPPWREDDCSPVDSRNEAKECECSETEPHADCFEDISEEQCPEVRIDDTPKNDHHSSISDLFGGLVGSEELLIIGVIILLTLASEDGKGGEMSDIVPILALLLLLK